MKEINVTIKGIAPLLQNRFQTELQGENKSRKKTKIYVPEDEAAKCLYKDEDGNIVQPAEHIYAGLVKAASQFTFEGKKTYKDIVKGGVTISPESIPLMKGKDRLISWDEIDTRPVVIQRARVLKWRPKFNDWELSFRIVVIDDENINLTVLREILDRCGQYGIGDYRPRFGRFQVTGWVVSK